MLISSRTICGYKLDSLDGEIGSVREFLFDDHYWAIRYLVANTGGWLSGRLILISPQALVAVEKAKESIAVKLTKKEIEESPPLESQTPVSRQFEESYYEYYGWPMYWNGLYMWGSDSLMVRDRIGGMAPRKPNMDYDPHLRSTHAVGGYHIQAQDGEIGYVEDFVVDDETWAIRYLVVKTHNWWPGKKVLISPPWIDKVSWNDSKVFVKLSREFIKHAPQYTEGALLTRSFEIELHEYYDRQGYWDTESGNPEKYS